MRQSQESNEQIKRRRFKKFMWIASLIGFPSSFFVGLANPTIALWLMFGSLFCIVALIFNVLRKSPWALGFTLFALGVGEIALGIVRTTPIFWAIGLVLIMVVLVVRFIKAFRYYNGCREDRIAEVFGEDARSRSFFDFDSPLKNARTSSFQRNSFNGEFGKESYNYRKNANGKGTHQKGNNNSASYNDPFDYNGRGGLNPEFHDDDPSGNIF
ncbi:hypothetical protein [Marinomonas algarum]|uniref:Uncharacterized protein n=1 Tax=Marinomonas algarum TaxID=2883105 RepID=A0A9X1INK2_9GAMM|nr:hypothetical protein [Marinomonas algarum]MCB5162607.1 hypothetical protein [Marinomonas algarum]